MKILILEDEIPAYQKLLSYIESEIQGAEVMGWARSVKEAKTLLQGAEQLELIFADVELLDGTSFQVFEAMPISCPIIFCTAFDRYMLKAFKTTGIAYLLKPYSIESFREAFQKYQVLFAQKQAPVVNPKILEGLQEALQGHPKNYKSRFIIKKREGIKLLETHQICCFEASGDFCVAIDSKGNKHVVNFTMSDLEAKVDPGKFFRISRSHMVNIDYIDHILSHSKNRLSIKLFPLVGKADHQYQQNSGFQKMAGGLIPLRRK